MSNLKLQAEAAAALVDAEAVGMDPITIASILTQVLPLVVSCWNKNVEPNAELSAKSFVMYYQSKPDECLRRTARRIKWESDEVTRRQSFLLAQAVIDQAMNSSQEEIKACCMEALKRS